MMNSLLIAALIASMILFPALYLVGVRVIVSWSWRHMSKKLMVALLALLTLTVTAWALGATLLIQHASVYVRFIYVGGMAIVALFLGSVLFSETNKAFETLRIDKKPLTLSEVVEAALK